MTTHSEEEQIKELFEQNGCARDLVVFACTSGYPVLFNHVCLLEITRIKEIDEKIKPELFTAKP